jgi:hypothetical protein
MRTKWLTSLVLGGLLLVGGAFLIFPRKNPTEVRPHAEAAAPPSGVSKSTAAVTNAAPSFHDGVPMQRVMELYERESRRVGQIDPDPKATQKRLEEDARELQPAEIRWLEGQGADLKNDADARFFAVYLLGLSHQQEAVGALGRLALSTIPKSKNDRLVEQERAFRASAVEGLSHLCGDFAQDVKDHLLNIVSLQRDEFLRDRANRGLYTCQYGKPMEDQDREALEKLRTK